MSPSRSEQGSTLIAVLLLMSLLLVAGLGLMSRKSAEYRRIALEEMSAQAVLLAQSGLEDATLKYGKDLDFPPAGALDQPLFHYSEEIRRADESALGRYSVTIDRTYVDNPSILVAVITCTGTVGPEDAPLARRTVRAEFDLNPARPTYFQLINYQDLGGL